MRRIALALACLTCECRDRKAPLAYIGGIGRGLAAKRRFLQAAKGRRPLAAAGGVASRAHVRACTVERGSSRQQADAALTADQSLPERLDLFFAAGGLLALLSRAFMLSSEFWGDDYRAADFISEHDRMARWFSGEVQGDDCLKELERFVSHRRADADAEPCVLELGAGKVGVWTNIVRLAAARRGLEGIRYFCSDLKPPHLCQNLVEANFAAAQLQGGPLTNMGMDHAAMSDRASAGDYESLTAYWPDLKASARLAASSFDLIVGSHLFCVCQDRVCEEHTCGGIPHVAGGVSGFLDAVLHLLKPGGACVVVHMTSQVPSNLRAEVLHWVDTNEDQVSFEEVEPHFKDRFQMASEFREIRCNGTADLRERFITMVMLQSAPGAYVFRKL